MSFDVRIYAYRGSKQVPTVLQKQMQTNIEQVLAEPYEFGEKLTSNGATPVTSTPDTTHNEVKILRVQVPDGQLIHYEVQPRANSPRVVSTWSPIMSGNELFEFYPGYRFSFIEATVS